MINMSTIEFEKRKYRIRQIEIKDQGVIKIASTELNDKLLYENGYYKSDEAIFVDEQIYFFVKPSILNLNDLDLIEHINKYCV